MLRVLPGASKIAAEFSCADTFRPKPGHEMRNAHLNSLGIAPNDVKAALAGEHRRAVRRRLAAIAAILASKSIRQAALAAKATRAPTWCTLR